MMADKIIIKDLALQCIIGTNPEEREVKQDIIINLTLECDLASAGGSDKIADTLNYKTLKKEILDFSKKSDFFLIERLADQIADRCLHYQEVKLVTVMVDKPGALSSARSVAVEIQRSRP